MNTKTFTITKKTQLTPDVFEIIMSTDTYTPSIPGQFITFILPNIGGRAYSIAQDTIGGYTFLIKRVADGRGGSKYICDRSEGDTLNAVGPSGHFVLKEEKNSKLFAGTGVGFAPLYAQILATLKSGNTSSIHLLFGVRFTEDLFYLAEIQAIQSKYPNFNYEVFVSREKYEGCKKGYITDALTPDIIENFSEFYVCGAPVVVDSVNEKLLAGGVEKEKIFFEKY